MSASYCKECGGSMRLMSTNLDDKRYVLLHLMIYVCSLVTQISRILVQFLLLSFVIKNRADDSDDSIKFSPWSISLVVLAVCHIVLVCLLSGCHQDDVIAIIITLRSLDVSSLFWWLGIKLKTASRETRRVRTNSAILWCMHCLDLPESLYPPPPWHLCCSVLSRETLLASSSVCMLSCSCVQSGILDYHTCWCVAHTSTTLVVDLFSVVACHDDDQPIPGCSLESIRPSEKPSNLQVKTTNDNDEKADRCISIRRTCTVRTWGTVKM